MNILKAGWSGKKKSSKGKDGPASPSSLAAFGPGAPPLQFQRSSQSLPPIVEDCLAWLESHQIWEVEGIFRISGDFHEIKALLRKYAKGKKVKLDEETTGLRAHTVACLLKTYLRELPIPLLTFELYKPFLSAIGVADEKARLELIKTTVALLPPANKALLTRLLALMRQVADHAEVNKMHSHNLAIVFAPCLLRPANDDLMVALMDGGVSQALLSTMIQHYSYFFLEKSDKTETTKQLAGEYKDFYKTLKKGPASQEETNEENGHHRAGTAVDDEDMEAGLACLSPELLRFAETAAEVRRRPTATGASGKLLPPPPRPTKPPPTKLGQPYILQHALELPAQPLPLPLPRESESEDEDEDARHKTTQERPRTMAPSTPIPREPEADRSKRRTTANLPERKGALPAAGEENAVLKKTRKSSQGAKTDRAGGDKPVEREGETGKKPTLKQISMSWNPKSQARRELGAAGEGMSHYPYPELEGSGGKELQRTRSTHIASIRRRLKQSSSEQASSSSSGSEDEADDQVDEKRSGGKRPSLSRSTPVAATTSVGSDSDDSADDFTKRRAKTSRSLRKSDSDETSDSDSDLDKEERSKMKKSQDKGDSDREEEEEDDDDDDDKVVTKRTMTYLTPEQMVKLVRQQRAQQRKELLAKKKKAASHSSSSSSDSSSSDDDDSKASPSTRRPRADTAPARKSPSPPPKSPHSPKAGGTTAQRTKKRGDMGRSMPHRTSASPIPARLAVSLPVPNEGKKESVPAAQSSLSSSSSSDDEEDEEEVREWSERMAEGDLAYFERLLDSGNDTPQPDLAALAKDVDLLKLAHFQ